jgi:hypothetical protein
MSPKNNRKRQSNNQFAVGSINKGISTISTVATIKKGCWLILLQCQNDDNQQNYSTNTLKPHITLYSHDTMALGHKHHYLLIAQSLAKSSLQASILLITGTGEASNFDIPSGIDY